MPEISRFLGIIITMFFNDHAPPHFHAVYAGRFARIALAPLRVLDGDLPPRVLGLVMEWASKHEPELQDDWQRASRSQPLERIEPLE
jgi:hypothetical protein